ncbi:efflux RND transporter permease subunit [Mycetocola spongiae]|uniref:efflux RND transporter permease subunit n=1 Tax=Mycetocola spongiae TaxID=2859226 RepID=UPI0021F41346|nr:efflux RND transporter permease subunit [Mycetocola spongiae]UCR90187.1 efflux RND transporter permease subunit [Mycetocola spongiae]
MVALLTLLITGVGLFSMASLKQELIPSISIPQTSVLTVSPGSSPEVVDEQIGLPLSQALKNVENVESVVSTSSANASIITVGSKFGVDQNELKANIRAAIDSVTTLPEKAEPQIMAGSVSDIPVVSLTASADGSLQELAAKLQSIAVPALEGIEGVREVQVNGAIVERVTISPNPLALAAAGLSPTAIADALEANGITLPVGTVREDGTSLSVTSGTAVNSVEDIRGLPLLGAGTPTTIGDVATVEITAEDATSITRTNGKESLALSITALPDADIVAISHDVTAALPGITTDLGAGASLVTIFDQAPFIEESISHLAIEGLLGLVFAVLIILIFLFSVRATIVTAISIPLSVLVTFIGLNLGGYSLNMLTLGALTIAIGRVVDDSIVVIENIRRHLSYGKPKIESILTGVREVAGAITASTLTTIMVFLPIALVDGMVGELFRPFALTVAIAMASSLLVALTIVPVLAYWFLGEPQRGVNEAEVQAAAEEKERKSRLQRAYVPLLRGTQKHPVITLVSSVVLLGLTFAMVPMLKVDFLGSTGQNSVIVTQEFRTGSELDAVSAQTEATEQAILETEGVESVLLTAGSGGMAAMLGGGGGTATFMVNTDKDADQGALQEDLKKRFAKLDAAEDITIGASSPGFGGSSVDVIVRAHEDGDALATAADLVYDAVKDTDQVSEVASDRAADTPSLRIDVNRTAAAAAGLTEIQVTGMIAATLSPSSVGSVHLGGSELSIYINNGTVPTTPAELEALILPTMTGMVPLTALASVETVNTPATITRDKGELIATISLTPEEGALGEVTGQVTRALDKLDLPAGVSAEVGGLSADQSEAFSQLGLAMLIAIAIVYLLMVATFRSLIQPLILLVSIPFAATGAIALLLATGRPLGIASLIGMLMLIGVVVTNAIVLIDLVNQYRRQGQSVADAVFNGARQRLRPILMTALATIFALIPMALGLTGSSGFISQDLAIVVIGGLISSTALTLILVPVLYRLIEGRNERRHAAREARLNARAGS